MDFDSTESSLFGSLQSQITEPTENKKVGLLTMCNGTVGGDIAFATVASLI